MEMVLRGVLGLFGLLFVVMAARFLLDPLGAAAALGVTNVPQSKLGQATIRGDFASFFGVGGAITLYAVLTNHGALLIVPAAMMAVTLVGRMLNQVSVGGGKEEIQPMVVEVIILALCLAGYRILPVAG